MSPPPPLPSARRALPTHAWKRGVLWALILAALILAAFLAFIAQGVMRQAGRDETRHADAIVVFGAAEYAGRPSPVYRARLDHAYDLFVRGLAPLIITCGGAGADPTYNEGAVGRDYLLRRGIPDRFLIAETQSDDTSEQAERVARILRANGLHSVLAVSDAYHMFRIKRLLGAKNIAAFASPRPESVPRTRGARLTTALREALSYTLWLLRIH
jgi:uncharacterized SAM-binding protein YcdF (DUF218 family)